MPTGYRAPRALRRQFFDLVCTGIPVIQAERQLGVSRNVGRQWWRKAGAMRLLNGKGDLGLAEPGDLNRPGGPGRRLSFDERIAIMRGLDAGRSPADIGAQLGRDRTVIWREVRRNRNPDGDYHARMAHARAARKAHRPKAFKLTDNPICASIEAWMDDGWSPKLIADVLARDHPDDKLARVSHETIYQCLYVQGRGSLRADLNKCLSTKRAARKTRGQAQRRGKFNDVFTISDRPPEVDDRAVPGHWEGDLILGNGMHQRDRHAGRAQHPVHHLVAPAHRPHRGVGGRRNDRGDERAAGSSTSHDHLGRGSEMASWRDIELQLQAPVYFCDPQAPWQRGTNENTNRLLRFWFEKSTDLSVHTKADLKRVQDTLNKRPRPTLDLDTPADRLAALLDQAA